jgi:hypothetical protein
MQRFLGFVAGPFSLATPIEGVRQILDVTGDGDGGHVHSMARLLGAEPLGPPDAVLAFDGDDGAVLVSCCRLRGVVDAHAPAPLPGTVACRRPGLITGTLDEGDELTLVVDPRVLVGLVGLVRAVGPIGLGGARDSEAAS